MSEPVDLIELTQELQTRPRGRACVILTHDYVNQKEWCEILAQETGTFHLDLLDHLEGSEEAGKLSNFSVDGLFKYLPNLSDAPVLIVSGLEFLMASWADTSMEKFASHIEMWSKQPALLIVTEYNAELARRKFTRFPDKLFVVDQQNTISLT